MNSVLPHDEAERAVKDSKKPRQNSDLKVSNNRWFVSNICAYIIAGACIAFGWHANDQSYERRELMYVKLYPSGNSDVDEFKPNDEQLFFRSTIDAALERFLNTRYGQQASTIKHNYAEAATFMSEAMYADFVGKQPGQYNALQKAADIAANPNSDIIETIWGFADHYDSIPAVFDKAAGEVVRTNVYFRERVKTSTGIIKLVDGNPEVKKILRLQWHLLAKKELSVKTKKWMRINPVGVEIISADVIEDPAGFEQVEAKTK